MPSPNSKTLSGLIEVSYELSEVITAKEEFHPNYKIDRDAFRRLIAARGRMERKLRRYFREASERLFMQIDWFEFSAELVKAQEFTRSIDWNGEKLLLSVLFTETLGDIYDLGIENMERSSGINTGFTSKELRFQKEISRHGLDLANSLTQTTKDRLNQILKTSLKEHRTIDESAARMIDVIDDPNRARMIARTETVNGHARGIVTAGRELGAKKKRWLYGGAIKGKVCPICAPLDNEVISIDKSFQTIVGPKDAPTAHPYCLCLLEIVF